MGNRVQLRCINLEFDHEKGGFDESPLLQLAQSTVVQDWQPYFYFYESRPCLTVLVSCRFAGAQNTVVQKAEKKTVSAGEVNQDDKSIELDEDETRLYELLRSWRNQTAAAAGIPPYVVLRNAQLRWLARHKPGDSSSLADLPGFGSKGLQKWGQALLEVLNKSGYTEKSDE